LVARRKSMPITQQQLLQILPNAGKQAGVFASGENL
jgi:putative chitinase